MKLRLWINQNSAVAMIVAVVGLAIAFQLVSRSQESNILLPKRAWYYDTLTGELFPSDPDQYPPITAPSGADGVLAKVFTCSACDSERRVAWLETYDKEDKERLEKLRFEPSHDLGEMMEIEERRLLGQLLTVHDEQDPIRWVKAASEAGQDIQLALKSTCFDGHFTMCYPK